MSTSFDQYNFEQLHREDEYYEMLKSLFPPGVIWVLDKINIAQIIQDVISGDLWQDTLGSTDDIQDTIGAEEAEGSLLGRILSCFAKEFSRLEADAWAILNQTDPGVAVDLLSDWERVLGLSAAGLTLEERQCQAHAKFLDAYLTTTEQFYIDYAASLGYTITVEEYPIASQPNIMGVARIGVQRMTATRGGYSVLQITVTDGPLPKPTLDYLQETFRGIKQAHVTIVWIDARP